MPHKMQSFLQVKMKKIPPGYDLQPQYNQGEVESLSQAKNCEHQYPGP